MTKLPKNATRPAKNATKTPVVATNPVPQIDSSQVITSNQTDKIFAALAKAQGEVQKARQTKKGEDEQRHETWNYAGLDDVLDAVKQARADNDLAVLELFPAGKAALRAVLVHGSGQWIDYGAYAFGEYKTQNEKSEIITRARRHFLKCIFGVVDQIEDKDGTTANRRTIGGEGMDEPLQEDVGGRHLTDKERRENYQEAKDAWKIDPVITADGRINYDDFAAGYEAKLEDVKTMNDLSMLGKANNKILNSLQEDRPDLFDHLQDVTSPLAQKLM